MSGYDTFFDAYPPAGRTQAEHVGGCFETEESRADYFKRCLNPGVQPFGLVAYFDKFLAGVPDHDRRGCSLIAGTKFVETIVEFGGFIPSKDERLIDSLYRRGEWRGLSLYEDAGLDTAETTAVQLAREPRRMPSPVATFTALNLPWVPRRNPRKELA